MKVQLKGRRFYSIEEIQEKSQAVLTVHRKRVSEYLRRTASKMTAAAKNNS